MMTIREAIETDIEVWSRMRMVLWPDSEDNHVAEIHQYFSGKSIDIEQVYVIDIDGIVVGFMELNIRNFAEGSRKPKVPYVEAWYIDGDYRGQGYGSQLMRQAEEWALALGYNELASDTELENERSISMHSHLGFNEVERVVCFLKKLGDT